MIQEKRQPSPFEAAFEAAEKFSNPLARSLVLTELAKTQFAVGRFDDAFRSIAAVPNRMEKKSVLIHLALDAVESGRIGPLPKLVTMLVETDPNSEATVGRLAQSLLERKSPNIEASLSLLALVDKPFDSDRSRYFFFEKLLDLGGPMEDVRKISTMFADENYRDWGRLALAKHSAKTGAWPEAEKLADGFSQPRRRSWAFLELARIAGKNSETKKVVELLSRSTEILEKIDVDPENIEPVTTQLRILGKTAYRAGETELGTRLLEQCEATAAKMTLSVPRFRAQYLLARTLHRLGLVADVDEYLDSKAIWNEKLSGLQRSLVLQWSAEAKGSNASDWLSAIREASRFEELPDNDFSQAERIIEIVRRYGGEMMSDKPTPGNDPGADAVNLSAEEFEDYYFSPFSIDDCGC